MLYKRHTLGQQRYFNKNARYQCSARARLVDSPDHACRAVVCRATVLQQQINRERYFHSLKHALISISLGRLEKPVVSRLPLRVIVRLVACSFSHFETVTVFLLNRSILTLSSGRIVDSSDRVKSAKSRLPRSGPSSGSIAARDIFTLVNMH